MITDVKWKKDTKILLKELLLTLITINYKMIKNHKWTFDDVCKICSLERKKIMDSKGNYIYYYLVNRKWVKERPICTPNLKT